MNRRAFLPLVLTLTGSLAVACSKDKQDDPASGMPVANNWSGQPAQPTQAESGIHHIGHDHSGQSMGGADPHAGLDMGGADPHAGLDMGGADPHAGLDMGGNPGGLEAPDPNRAIDPSKFVKGTLSASPATASLIKPGAIIFISVRPINKATGESLGAPLAVDRLDVTCLPIDFHLSGAQTMVAGTRFEGDVMIYARFDSDGEASSTLPGDIEGRLETTIPAEGLSLVLDTIVK